MKSNQKNFNKINFYKIINKSEINNNNKKYYINNILYKEIPQKNRFATKQQNDDFNKNQIFIR